MKLVRISSMTIGLLMIAQWIFFIVTGNVPELDTAPVSILFHLIIELVTAALLIITGFLVRPNRRSVMICSTYVQGMLGYTVVNSSGYFAQNGPYLLTLMFAVILAVSILNMVSLFRGLKG